VREINNPTFVIPSIRTEGLSERVAAVSVEGTMRRVAVIVGLCALLFPLAAWANGIDLTNEYGTVIITTAGVVTTGSHLMSFDGIPVPRGRAMGSVSFSTGAFTGASIWTGGTFSSTNSSFIVTGIGNLGQPKGVIFSGAFVGPISWTVVSHTKWDYVFKLSGEIRGQIWTGRVVTGTTTQTIYAYKNQWSIDHDGGIHLGNSHLVVPEPGTLGLLGMGLIVVAGTMRRKFFGS